MPSYVPLWCKSNFSFLEGASHPDELVEEAHHLGIGSLALTDMDGVYGMVRAHVKARELGVQLIAGSEITLDDDSTILLLAQNAAGYANLCRLISTGRLGSPKGSSKVSMADIGGCAPGLIALWRGGRGAKLLKEAFGDRLYGMVARHRCAEEQREEVRLKARARRYGIPLVGAGEVLYHTPARRPLQDVLTCIREKCTVSTAKRRIRSNGEHFLKSPVLFEELFSDDPDLVLRTEEVAARCDFSLSELTYRYPSERLPDQTTSFEWLERLTFDGAKKTVPGHRALGGHKAAEKGAGAYR